MSKTDKTHPYWVLIRDRIPAVQFLAHHRCHSRHVTCDLQVSMPVTRRHKNAHTLCSIWPRYQDNDQIYGRRPRGKHRRDLSQDGRARAALRRLRHQWLATVDIQAIDSFEDAPTRRWLWAGWWWD